jgi:hypothetical protein
MALELLYEMMEIDIQPSVVNFRTVFFGFNREFMLDFHGTTCIIAIRCLCAIWNNNNIKATISLQGLSYRFILKDLH